MTTAVSIPGEKLGFYFPHVISFFDILNHPQAHGFLRLEVGVQASDGTVLFFERNVRSGQLKCIKFTARKHS